METILVLVVILVLVAVASVATWLLGMRASAPWALDLGRTLTKRVFNPMQMRSAGTPGAYASIVRHTGRKSGATYETPVGTVVTEDGFLIALPYGTRANWVQNVLAAGSATIVAEGQTYEVDQPEVVPLESVISEFPEGDLRSLRLFGVEHGLRVRRVGSEREAARQTEA
jgi:deazaflavin-dependent oxidoreductase (nitroreductase family)